MNKHLFPLLASLVWAITASAQVPADPLAKGFEAPPDSAKPWTWWHWVSGNISKEGITADLEAMKEIGLGGAQIFTVDQSKEKGPVKFATPEWYALVQHALAEAHRLGLTISMMDCDGWSESGGPWVKPNESMQKVVWTETRVQGGRKIALECPQPRPNEKFYEDIALFAFPATAADKLPAPARLTTSDPKVPESAPASPLVDSVTLIPNAQDGTAWITLEYAAPVTFQSVRFVSTERARQGNRTGGLWELQASDDGVDFHTVSPMGSKLTTAFKPVSAKFFRFSGKEIGDKEFALKELRLGGPQLEHLEKFTGASDLPDIKTGEFAPINLPPEEIVDSHAMVNLTGRQEWDAPEGEWVLLRLGHTSTGVHTAPATSWGLECDKLSAPAVERHIHAMFDPILSGSAVLAGATLGNILLDSWEAHCENWTDTLPAEFQKRRGYDLLPWLPALSGRTINSPEQTQRFLWDFRRTIADLTAEVHYGTIQKYAREHKLGLYAEAVGIGMPAIADELQCKKFTDVPMGEFWTNEAYVNANEDDPREAASAAHLYGKPLAAAEAFTASASVAAWVNDPYALKVMGDKAFCCGINQFIFHRYAHQPWLDRQPGMCMGPWGINFERTNTWWKPGAAWVGYITRCQHLLQQGRFQADFCYFYGEGAPMCFKRDLMKPAPPQGYDFDVCNADVLLHSMTVENGKLTLPSGMSYRALVLPATARMTLPVIQKLQALVRDGATVYGAKPLQTPSLSGYPEADGKLAAIAAEVWGDCDGKAATEHAYGKGRVVWGQPLEQVLGGVPDFKATQAKMSTIHRRIGEADVYFVSNQSPRELTAECTFRIAGKVPELWDPMTGTRRAAALYKTAGSQTTLPLHFDPSGSLFVVFRKEAAKSPHWEDLRLDGKPFELGYSSSAEPFPHLSKEGKIEFRAADPKAEPNGARLPVALPVVNGGKVEFTAFAPGTYEATAAHGAKKTVKVAPLPEPFELTGPWKVTFPPNLGAPANAVFERLISWTDSDDDGIKHFSGTAVYDLEFTLPPGLVQNGRALFLDLGTVKNLAEVTLNGKNLGILWKPPFRVELPAAGLKKTGNRLQVKVTNLWPNRLIGDAALPKEKRITWTSQGEFYKSDSPLLASGLIGKVTLVSAQKISLPGE